MFRASKASGPADTSPPRGTAIPAGAFPSSFGPDAATRPVAGGSQDVLPAGNNSRGDNPPRRAETGTNALSIFYITQNKYTAKYYICIREYEE